MGKERVGGDSSNQGQGLTGPWEGLAAASNNYVEQQPDGAEVHEDAQGGDEAQREQEVAAPMTFDDLCRTVTAMNDVYWEYNDEKRNTKPDTQRQREEILTHRAERIRQARKEFDERCRIIREAASARLKQIEESTEAARAYAQKLALIKEDSSKLMGEVMAPLVAADKASDETLRQFISDFDEQQERGKLTPDDIQLSDFVIAIAKRNSWQRKDVLRISANLECEKVAPWEAKLSEASPVVYVTNDCEALSGSRQCAALQLPPVVLELGEGAIEGYIRRMLEPYAREGIISSRYRVYVDEGSYYDGVHIREVRIESNCGGFVLSEDTTNRLDS